MRRLLFGILGIGATILIERGIMFLFGVVKMTELAIGLSMIALSLMATYIIYKELEKLP